MEEIILKKDEQVHVTMSRIDFERVQGIINAYEKRAKREREKYQTTKRSIKIKPPIKLIVNEVL